MPTPRRCLVLRRGGLGDTLLMVPVLRALARAFPHARLEFAGVAEFGAVLAAYGVVATAHSSEDFALWSPALARPRLAAFDLVIADDRAAVDAAPAAALGFDPAPRAKSPLSQQIAAQLGLVVTLPDDAQLAAPPVPLTACCVLAPGSGSRTKNWPRAHWLALAAALPATAALAVVVGPTEQERDDPRTWAWPRPAQFLVDVAVVALASRLREASLFVGNDSGTTHLAAMLGLPTVALFGPSNAGVFSPQGPEVAVLQAPAGELAELAPATVLAAAVGLQSGSRARTRRQ